MPNCWRCPGLRSPYPGKLGVVEEGALADLILVDGNPLENIQLDRRSRQELFHHHERRESGEKPGFTLINARMPIN